MKTLVPVLLAAFVWPLSTAVSVLAAEPDVASLPAGVSAVWDMGKAATESTPTRQRISINGLWQWQPADAKAEQVPADKWGYFKVPGCWPGISDYMQKDCQTVFTHPSWENERLGGIAAAWYRREIAVPESWKGRRIALNVDCLNSFAAVCVDGKRAGEIRFPGGEADLTGVCRPGSKHTLSLLVVAMPLKAVMVSYNDTAAAREVKGTVQRRGLCGDVYLIGEPAGPRIADVKVDTSVRKGEISLDAGLQGLAADAKYTLHARISQPGDRAIEFTSKPFQPRDLQAGRFAFTEKWKPERLWDIHTPENKYDVQVSLRDAAGKTLDAALPVRFGFREFWIDGRDFYLNGTRIHLSVVPLDNAQIGAAWASYEGARESLERLKRIGINFVYAHNYGCEPGSHLSFAEILRAADDVGMLVALSQPHFSHYDWKAADADANNGYARHAEYYVRIAQNHPSVVCYSMSHNATGYSDDMNPHMLDGIQNPRDTWSSNNAKLALRAEAIVRRFDPVRFVYHHAGGNIGALHSSNFYPNFVPIQELSDWFEHWAAKGVKPAYLCEYGAPFTWDWSMYRGWYKGQRSFGSARVPWEFCFAEWNAQFLGDRAFKLCDAEKTNLRWEAKQFQAGRVWNRWDYPYEIGSRAFDDRHTVIGMYLTDNWRAFRTWGVSAISPWEYGHYWRLRDGVEKRREELPVDWEKLQRPGFSPDYIDGRYERFDLAFKEADWIATADGDAVLRNNRPLLAYIAGKPARFTSKDHNFFPGETVEKQLIVINDSRETVTCECRWWFGLPEAPTGAEEVTVPAGQQKRVPIRYTIPERETDRNRLLLRLGFRMLADFRFSTGETQTDTFAIDPLPRPATARLGGRTALFDPKGETTKLLQSLNVAHETVKADADLAGYDVLIVGKGALTPDGPVPDIMRVREGLKVVCFEQTSQALEKRLGFRVVEYGLRQVFPRVPDHPLLVGLAADHLRDWRGEATLLPPRLTYEMRPMHGPTVQWCGIPVTRVWRCGNYGNVASVLIEKPARGDFLPILDGGFSLQFSPLLEYREGRGMMLFCQLDVTGRSESDPAADTLVHNILNYVSSWKPGPRRTAVYAGDPAGKRHLEAAGVAAADYDGGKLSSEQVLVVSPGGGRKLASSKAAIADWLKAGGNLLAVGLDEQDAAAMLPLKVTMKKAEHIAAYFDAPGKDSPFAGLGPADVHNRDPRQLPLVTAGATPLGNGVLAKIEGTGVVFCQLAPWQFDYAKQYNLKRTFRRTSCLVARLLGNLGVGGATPLLSRFHEPVDAAKPEKRFLDGLYLDQPEEMDDPYRFFRW